LADANLSPEYRGTVEVQDHQRGGIIAKQLEAQAVRYVNRNSVGLVDELLLMAAL